MQLTKEKGKIILSKVKGFGISFLIFFLSYMVFYMFANAVGFAKQPIGQDEYNLVSSQLEKIEKEENSLSIEIVKTEKETELTKLNEKKSTKEKEIKTLKENIEKQKKKL